MKGHSSRSAGIESLEVKTPKNLAGNYARIAIIELRDQKRPSRHRPGLCV